MKKILIVLLVATLSGCAMLDAYNMAKFDSNEYQLAAKVRTIAEVAKADCSDASLMKGNANTLLIAATEFKNFTANIIHNEEALSMAKNLLLEVKGLQERYKKEGVSEYYCTTKMTIIEQSATTVQTALGAKPR